MAAINVQVTRKDNGGNITHLCNFNEFRSPRHKNDVILEIERNLHSYYIFIAGKTIDNYVIDSPSGKYPRTDPDKTERNKLDELSNC